MAEDSINKMRIFRPLSQYFVLNPHLTRGCCKEERPQRQGSYRGSNPIQQKYILDRRCQFCILKRKRKQKGKKKSVGKGGKVSEKNNTVV